MQIHKRFRVGIFLAVFLFGLSTGTLALLGQLRWGNSGWYFHFTPTYRLRVGENALRQGNADAVLRVVQVLEDGGHYDQAHLLKGDLLFRQGRELADAGDGLPSIRLLTEAVSELNQIADRDELRLEAAAILGQCLLYLKDYREAERTLHFVIAERREHIDAHRALAVLYYQQGAMMLAVRHLEKVAELDPEDGRPYRLLGTIYKDIEAFTEAAASLRESLSRKLPGLNREQIRLELAECLVKLNRLQAALEILEELKPPPSGLGLAAALRGECFLNLERPIEANEIVSAALLAEPFRPELLRLRARMHLDAREPRQAVDLLNKAIRADRHDYLSRHLMVLACGALGMKADAEEHQRLLEKTHKDVLELSRLNKELMDKPWDVATHRRLAELAERLDRFGEAAMWKQAALACEQRSRNTRNHPIGNEVPKN